MKIYKIRKQKALTTKSIKGNHSGRQKMIPAGNPNLHTGIKSVGNGVCVGREKRLLFIFKKWICGTID